jgi:hypothetical protein
MYDWIPNSTGDYLRPPAAARYVGVDEAPSPGPSGVADIWYIIGTAESWAQAMK